MGGQGAGPDTGIDTSSLNQELAGLRDPNSPEAQAIQGLVGGQLSPQLSNAFAAQTRAVDVGAGQARQAVSQSVRAGTAARGLFSSDIAVGAEAQALGGLEQQLATQRAGILGQQGQTIQGGILSGLQASQSRAGLRGQLAQGITGASQAEAQANAQAFGAQQKLAGAQAGAGAQIGSTLLKGILAPATGGLSLGL